MFHASKKRGKAEGQKNRTVHGKGKRRREKGDAWGKARKVCRLSLALWDLTARDLRAGGISLGHRTVKGRRRGKSRERERFLHGGASRSKIGGGRIRRTGATGGSEPIEGREGDFSKDDKKGNYKNQV